MSLCWFCCAPVHFIVLWFSKYHPTFVFVSVRRSRCTFYYGCKKTDCYWLHLKKPYLFKAEGSFTHTHLLLIHTCNCGIKAAYMSINRMSLLPPSRVNKYIFQRSGYGPDKLPALKSYKYAVWFIKNIGYYCRLTNRDR